MRALRERNDKIQQEPYDTMAWKKMTRYDYACGFRQCVRIAVLAELTRLGCEANLELEDEFLMNAFAMEHMFRGMLSVNHKM